MQRAGRLIGKLKLPPTLKDPEGRARAAWRVAAGSKISEHTRPTMLVRDTLVVEVEDLVWQYQLNTLRHFLLRNLAEVLGEPLIKEIDFRPTPRRRPAQKVEIFQSHTLDGEGIHDPVLGLLYQQSKKKGLA